MWLDEQARLGGGSVWEAASASCGMCRVGGVFSGGLRCPCACSQGPPGQGGGCGTVTHRWLGKECLGGVLESDLPAPGKRAGGESWWVGHRPLQAQHGSRGPGVGLLLPPAWNMGGWASYTSCGLHPWVIPTHHGSIWSSLPGVSTPLGSLLFRVPAALGPPMLWYPCRSQAGLSDSVPLGPC